MPFRLHVLSAWARSSTIAKADALTSRLASRSRSSLFASRNAEGHDPLPEARLEAAQGPRAARSQPPLLARPAAVEGAVLLKDEPYPPPARVATLAEARALGIAPQPERSVLVHFQVRQRMKRRPEFLHLTVALLQL